MSSIISDIFYGSKQNILDNYLVHRHDRQHTSTLHKQDSPPHSYIQFIITPAQNSIDFSTLLKVQVELGNHAEEEMLQLSPDVESPAVVTFHEMEKAELGKLTNVKITVSEGRQWRAFGFIPIETIRSTISSPSGEKTVLVQLKGKDARLSTLQCTIRTEFPTNTILNSEIMRSMEREHHSYIRSKHQISDQSSHLRPNMPRSPNQRKIKRKSPSNSRSGQFSKPSLQQKQSSYVADGGSRMERRKESDVFGDGGVVTQYVKEIKSIQLIFSKLDLIQSLKAPEPQIALRAAGLDYSIGEIIEVKAISKHGANVELVVRGKVIGRIHISPLLLTLSKISGDLPIYSELEQCMGTVFVQSPYHIDPPRPQTLNQQQPHPLPSEQVLNDLVAVSIEKLLLVRPQEHYENDHFEFSKMQVSKVEVVARLNDTIHRFSNVALHRNPQGQCLQVAELRRKDGFSLHYLQQAKDEILLEIEVFSAYRLIAYGKTTLNPKSHFLHSFIPGQSQCSSLHSCFYAKVVRLQPKQLYFQENRIDIIFNVLEDLISNKIVLTQVSDAQVKRMMNLHHNATYVELKKLAILLQAHQDQLQSFQSGSLLSTQSYKASTQRLWGKLLDEFLCVQTKEGSVNQAEFTKIIEFYNEEIHGSLEGKFQQFISNPVRTQNCIKYLFFITGYYFLIKHLPKSPQVANDWIPAPIPQPKPQQPIVKEGCQGVKHEGGGVKAEPCYYISKISINNAHLLAKGRAPNICLSVGRKVCYSNSNPEFNLQREVSLLTPIKVYHKSIAEDRLVEVAEFHLLRRQTHYQLNLTGKCFAKVTWGP